ncbi:Reducing polyketide synthase rads1, partial [Paraphaeosphaeria minitans]
NPDILKKWKMEVPLKPTTWPVCQTTRMSVSGFGMGGTNAHLVLEEHQKKVIAQHTIDLVDRFQKRFFVFSSHDQAGVKPVSQSLVEHLDALGPAASSPEFLANLAHTLSTARSGLSWKETCMACNTIELREQLSTSLGDTAARGWSGKHPPCIGLVFMGQGAQWARMGIELLDRRVFRESVTKSTQYVREMGCDWDPVAELRKAPAESRVGKPEVSQPICSVLQIALVDELRSWGVYPSKVVGHSSGEIAATYSIGALSHRDALAVAFFRGKVSKGLTNLNGGMMAVGCTPELAQEIFIERNLQATVAC